MVARVLDSGVLRPVHHLKMWPRVTFSQLIPFVPSAATAVNTIPFCSYALCAEQAFRSRALAAASSRRSRTTMLVRAFANALAGEATTWNNQQETRINRGIKDTPRVILNVVVGKSCLWPPQ
jgi:hypothetical protein